MIRPFRGALLILPVRPTVSPDATEPGFLGLRWPYRRIGISDHGPGVNGVALDASSVVFPRRRRRRCKEALAALHKDLTVLSIVITS